MSQLSSTILGAPPFSGPVLTLTGDIGTPATVTPSAGNINIFGDPNGFIIVQGNVTPNNHTLTIKSNQVVGTTTTNDATPTIVAPLILDLTMGNSSAYLVQVIILCTRSDYTKASSGSGVVSAVTDAFGISKIVGGQNINFSRFDRTFIPSAQFILTGNTLQVEVTGLAATQINWLVVQQHIII